MVGARVPALMTIKTGFLNIGFTGLSVATAIYMAAQTVTAFI